MTDTIAIGVESLAAVGGTLALAVWALRETALQPSDQSEPGKTVLRFRVRQAGRNRTVGAMSGAILGRADACDIVVDEATVSKRHARVTYDGSVWMEDLASTNGTYVNGMKIDGTTVLRKGDRIALGAAKIVFLGSSAQGKGEAKG